MELKANLKEAITTGDYTVILNNCISIKEVLLNAKTKKAPNFFSLAYYLTFVKPEIPTYDIEQLDLLTREYLDKDFMIEFIARVEKALELSHKESISNNSAAKNALIQLKTSFENNEDKEIINELTKTAIHCVEESIDKLDIYRKNLAYVFKSSILDSMKTYYSIDKNNMLMTAKYEKDKAAYEKVLAKGKVPNWNLVPITLWDKEVVKQEIIDSIQDMINNCDYYLNEINIDLNVRAIDMIDYFKQNASNVVNKLTPNAAKLRAIKLMEEVGIPEPNKRYRQYPFEFSGGMRQRIVIAIALAANPEILICDEPTTALDVTIQSQILELINKLKAERNLSIIFITHDMGVVANMADRIAVMYAGKIVELGTSDDVFYDPKHPYTWALLSSMPDLDTKEKLDSIPGTPPNMINPPVGDAFAARNKYAMKIDFEKQPPFFKVSDTHYAATWLLHPDAPKVEMPKTLLDRIERMKNAQGGEQ